MVENTFSLDDKLKLIFSLHDKNSKNIFLTTKGQK